MLLSRRAAPAGTVTAAQVEHAHEERNVPRVHEWPGGGAEAEADAHGTQGVDEHWVGELPEFEVNGNSASDDEGVVLGVVLEVELPEESENEDCVNEGTGAIDVVIFKGPVWTIASIRTHPSVLKINL